MTVYRKHLGMLFALLLILSLAACSAAAPAVKTNTPANQPVNQTTGVKKYHLKTGMHEGKMAFFGVGGVIWKVR